MGRAPSSLNGRVDGGNGGSSWAEWAEWAEWGGRTTDAARFTRPHTPRRRSLGREQPGRRPGQPRSVPKRHASRRPRNAPLAAARRPPISACVEPPARCPPSNALSPAARSCTSPPADSSNAAMQRCSDDCCSAACCALRGARRPGHCTASSTHPRATRPPPASGRSAPAGQLPSPLPS